MEVMEELLNRIIEKGEEFIVWLNGVQVGITLYKVNMDLFWDKLHRELELRNKQLKHISNTYWVE